MPGWRRSSEEHPSLVKNRFVSGSRLLTKKLELFVGRTMSPNVNPAFFGRNSVPMSKRTMHSL